MAADEEGQMRLTKLGHSCVRLEKDGAVLVIDPGGWSGAGVLSGASAVLVTHEHPDHLDADEVRAAMAGDPGLELWTNATVAGQFGDFGARVHAVDHGDTFTAAGFDVHVYGHDHAQIYREIPIVLNTGFAVDGEVFHPGDSLTVPEDRVPTLLVPLAAPWLKASEMIDYAREVAPQRAYAIHDAILNANGLELMERMLQLAAKPSGAAFSRLEPGSTVDL
jgi:L-ascorbate metabolism protein UlaG (beta-lactamase superfamily)